MSLAIKLTKIKAQLAVVLRNYAWRTISVTILQETMDYYKGTGVEHVRTLLGSLPSVSNAWPVSTLQRFNVPFNFYALANLIFADNDGFMYQCPTNSSNWCCYSTVLNNTCDCDTGAHVLQLGPPGGVVKAPQIQATAPLGWVPTSTSTNIAPRKKSWNKGETIGVVIGCLFASLVAIGSVLFCLRRLRRKNRPKARDSGASSEESGLTLEVGAPNGFGTATFAMPANAIVE
jgi:hypothetical protein